MNYLFRVVSIVAVSLATNGHAWSQTFPTRPVKLIVPFPAGGATDVVVRALAQASEKHLGQTIIVENRPGAGGALAPQQMAASAMPDGYVISQIPQIVFRPAVGDISNFDPLKKFTFIMGLTSYTFGVVVRSDAPWTDFAELLADAKMRTGRITIGTSGVGTTPHLTMMQIAKSQGVDWIYVPFRGSSEALNAVLAGHIDVMADGSTWSEMVNAGKLRLLVTWGAHRSSSWSQVPTLTELGIDIVANAPYGIAGPAGMDPTTVKKLHDAFKNGMEDSNYLLTLRRLDQQSNYLNSNDYAEYAKRETASQTELMKRLGLSK
jgi:tripartite-type tricarboxylate transporter receptor subunit TctC